MSEPRLAALQVKREGAAQRRNWNPDPSSAHYRVYKWWLSKTNRRIYKENFCHYWRVVFIWAPLRWLLKPALGLLAIAAIVVAFWAAVSFTSAFVATVLIAAALLYVWYCVDVGQQLVYDLNSPHLQGARPVPWLRYRSGTIKALAIFSALPVLICFAVGMSIIVSIISIFIGLAEDYDLYGRFGRWFAGGRFGGRMTNWARPWMGVPVALAVSSIWVEWMRSVVLYLLLLGVVLGVMTLLSYFADKAKMRERERLEQAKREQLDRLFKRMFSVMHPHRRNSDERYKAWRIRYGRFCRGRLLREDEYDASTAWHLEHLAPRYRKVLSPRRTTSLPPVSKTVTLRRRSRKLLDRGSHLMDWVVDYLALAWSIVLVKKWKICPWVDISR